MAWANACTAGRLIVPGYHHRRALVRLQVFHQRGHKLLLLRLGASRFLRPTLRRSPALPAPPPKPAPAADDRPCRRCWSACSPPCRSATSSPSARDCVATKLPRITQKSRIATGKKIAIKRKNRVRLIEAVARLDILPKRHLRTRASVIAVQRVVLHPLRLGIRRQHRIHLRGQRRRTHRAGQDAQPRATAPPSASSAAL